MPKKRIFLATDREIELAQERHCVGSDDEIEVDPGARVSRGEDGAWVAGWLFVPKDLLGDTYQPD